LRLQDTFLRPEGFLRRKGLLGPEDFLRCILLPFLASRAALFLAGWFARDNFAPNPTYAEYARRGYFLTRFFWVDMWAHWDAKWYLSIVQEGYRYSEPLTQSYSNLAFFPLYPYLVRALIWPIPGGLKSEGLALLVGLVISNACFLLAAWLIYRLALAAGGDPGAAKRTVELLVVFPAGFFFSSFYPESLFLALTAGALWAAACRRWWLAGLLGLLAAVTRGQGLLIAAPLAWMYMQERRWQWRAIRPDVLWLALLPIGLLTHLASLYQRTGDFLAPMRAQAAWGRWGADWWSNLQLQLGGPGLDPFKLDFALLVIFVLLTLAMFRRPAWRAFALYSFLLLALPIATALFVSVSRYLAVVFPVFIYLGSILKDGAPYQMVRAVSFGLQVVYFVGFVNYYWIA